MGAPAEAAVRAAVNTVGDPCSAAHGMPIGIEDMGLVEHLGIEEDGRVSVRLRLTSPCCGMIGYFIEGVTERVSAVPDVRSVDVTVDAGLDWEPSMMSDRAREQRRENLRGLGIPLSIARV
jgi:metal-sulfur cluster biosynthetic enzyme